MKGSHAVILALAAAALVVVGIVGYFELRRRAEVAADRAAQVAQLKLEQAKDRHALVRQQEIPVLQSALRAQDKRAFNDSLDRLSASYRDQLEAQARLNETTGTITDDPPIDDQVAEFRKKEADWARQSYQIDDLINPPAR